MEPRGLKNVFSAAVKFGAPLVMAAVLEVQSCRRNISATPGDFETETIADFVLPGLMYLDQYVLVALIGDGPAGLDTGPIEHSELV